MLKSFSVDENIEEATIPAPVKETSIFDSPDWTGVQPATETNDEHKFAGIRFQRVGKVYHYRAEGFDDLKIGDYVIVETVRGRQMGQVATTKPPKDRSMGFRRIERKATGRDMAMRHYYENKELEAMIAGRAEASALNLPIKVARAEYSYDGQTLTFLYSTIEDNDQVYTEGLREALSHLYQARIEIRQIGPREVAKIIGGMGACGIEERCCSKFLTEFSPVSIKHAKEQNISLNPNDITGMCGRLRCCLVYEYEQYVEARRHLPKLKNVIGTPQGEGKVVELLALRDSVRVMLGGETEERTFAVFHREQLVPLEEYRRLQEKAASGTCDRHESGGCDCGKGKPAPAATVPSPKTELPPPPPRGREQKPQQSRPAQPRPASQRPLPKPVEPEITSDGIEVVNSGLTTPVDDRRRRDEPRREERPGRRDERPARRDDRRGPAPRRDEPRRGPTGARPPRAERPLAEGSGAAQSNPDKDRNEDVSTGVQTPEPTPNSTDTAPRAVRRPLPRRR